MFLLLLFAFFFNNGLGPNLYNPRFEKLRCTSGLLRRYRRRLTDTHISDNVMPLTWTWTIRRHRTIKSALKLYFLHFAPEYDACYFISNRTSTWMPCGELNSTYSKSNKFSLYRPPLSLIFISIIKLLPLWKKRWATLHSILFLLPLAKHYQLSHKLLST